MKFGSHTSYVVLDRTFQGANLRTAFVGLTLLSLVATVGAASAAEKVVGEVAFELVHDEIVIEVFINGRGPFRMMVDTGTTPSAIDTAVATKIGLRLGESAPGSGAGTEAITAQETEFDELSLGTFRAKKVAAATTDLTKLKVKVGPIDGVLGYSVLRGKIVQFDYPNRRLRFFSAFDARPAAKGSIARIPFRLNSYDGPIIDRVVVKNRRVTAILDTGSSEGLLFTPEAIRRIGFAEEMAKSRSSGAMGYAGTFTVLEGKIANVRIGTLTLESPDAIFTPPKSGHDGQGYDVNIGNRLMKEFVVTLDYKKKVVYFETVGTPANNPP